MSRESDIEALKAAQPAWRAEGIGVRGNPVDFQREQAQVNWPGATFTRRDAADIGRSARPGAPDQPKSVPAA